MSHGLGFEIWFEIMAAEINQPRGWTELIKSPRADRVFDQLCPHPMSMSGSYPRKSVSNFIITLYAKLYQIVIETNLICDVIIINNKIRHNSFTIFTTRRVLHTEPYFLQNIVILSVWPPRGHLAARGVITPLYPVIQKHVRLLQERTPNSPTACVTTGGRHQ